MDFKHRVSRTDNGLRLILEGLLDTLSSTELEKTVRELSTELGKGIELDITDLSYISSSGLRCFVELFKGCKKVGSQMRFVGMQPSIHEIFNLTGFTRVFGINAT